MTISFYQDIEDVMAFQQNALATNKQVQKSLKLLRYALPVLIIIVDLMLANHNATDGFALPIPGAIIAVIWLVFMPRWYNRSIMSKTKAMMLDPMNDSFFGFREMTFDENGFSVSGSHSSSRLDWVAVKKLTETPTHYFIYISTLTSFTIPKSKITQEEVAELDRLLKTYTA